MDMPQQPPGQQGMEPMAEESTGFTVCIQVNGDGTFAVGKESAEQEAMEGEAAPEAGMKPAKDAKTALTMALALMRGEVPADESEQAKGFQEAFSGDKMAGAM